MVIQAGLPASIAGSDDASGTLRVHKDNFRMYNVNVTNTFGIGSQAIAISQYGNQVGLYACSFIGYQDTLYANQGAQVFLKSYIEVRNNYNNLWDEIRLTFSMPGSCRLHFWETRFGILRRKHNSCKGSWLYYCKRERIG